MVAFVAAWMLVGVQKLSSFERLFPHPTGGNALEDYLQAGDLLTAGHFNLYQSWQPPEKRPTPEELRQQAEENKKALEALDPKARELALSSDPPPTGEETQLTDHLNSLSFLEVKREEVNQFEAAIELISGGNRKPIVFPTGIADPELSWLGGPRQSARLVSDAAYLEFSEGQPDRAVAHLSEVLTMAHRMGAGDLIGQLSCIGSTSIVLNRFNEQMGCLSLAETRAVARLAGELLDDTDTLRQMARNEGLVQEVALDQALRTGPDASPKRDQFPFTAEQMAAVREQLPQALAAQNAQAPAFFQRPEEEWLANTETSPDGSANPPNNATTAQLVQYLLGLVTPVAEHQPVLAILRSRAQLRLLRLHALIREYRWENGSYPESLEKMNLPREDTYDPLSHKNFQYELHDGTYRVYSPGTPETGPIELRYRRQPGAAATSDGPVPP